MNEHSIVLLKKNVFIHWYKTVVIIGALYSYRKRRIPEFLSAMTSMADLIKPKGVVAYTITFRTEVTRVPMQN